MGLNLLRYKCAVGYVKEYDSQKDKDFSTHKVLKRIEYIDKNNHEMNLDL